MTHATETARRENLRDVWSQKTRKAGIQKYILFFVDFKIFIFFQTLETLLITNTLMFGCFFAVLVEGL